MSESRGPVMIAATSMLRPPPERVGKLGEKLVLPRSIELKKALAGVAGLVLGVAVWTVLWRPIIGGGLEGFLGVSLAFTVLGVGFVTVSPLRGESMLKWLSLSAQARRGSKVSIGGQNVKAFIGIAPLNYSAQGPTRVVPAAVDVLPGTVDERGVPISPAEARRRKFESANVAPAFPAAHEGFAPPQRLSSGS